MSDIRCRYLWTGEGSFVEDAVVRVNDSGIICSIEPISFESPHDYDFTFAMPSFTDAHCHFSWMAVKAASRDFSCAGSCEEFLCMVKKAVSGREQMIVRGESFDESEWPVPEMPSLDRLDDVSGDVPVFLRRVCGHAAIANSAMLRLITLESKDINRTTGIIREWPSMNFDRMFPLPAEVLQDAFSTVTALLYSKGITGVCSMETADDAAVLLNAGIPLDVSFAVSGDPLENLPAKNIRPGMVKFFLDGSIGARNAAVFQPYSNGTAGELVYTDDQLRKLLVICGENGLKPVFHAIGGRALSQLDRVSNEVFRLLCGGYEIRVEHAEDLLCAWPGCWNPDYHIFSMQPNFVERWQRQDGMYDRNLSALHSLQLNPFRTVLSSGFRLGFGSDSMPPDPLYGIRGAVFHRNIEQSLTAGEALKAYTLGSASISELDNLAVPLRAGRKADIVFLSGNPFHGIEGVEVSAAMRNGITVYRKNGIRREFNEVSH
jgi:predicted amidohydrolase YtcJ